MRMLLSFGVRRHMVHAAPEPSYEAMLALDENNPRRGVKKQILEQLPHVRNTASRSNRQPISSVMSVILPRPFEAPLQDLFDAWTAAVLCALIIILTDANNQCSTQQEVQGIARVPPAQLKLWLWNAAAAYAWNVCIFCYLAT